MLIDRIFNGNDAVYGLTCQAVEEAIAQHGADKAVEFPHTAYCLPCYYAVTGVKVKTLGEMKEALGVIKSLMTREHQLDDALMSGVATALCAEFIEVLKYLDGAEPYSEPYYGHLPDSIIRELGVPLVTGDIPGVAVINDTKKKREVIVTDQETGESKTYLIPYGSRIKITDGQILEAGDELTEGSVNPHDILRIKGVRAVQDYMIREVQRVYRLQGVEINDKHIEVIVRQMLKKIRIEDNGDTEFLPGTLVDFLEYEDVNEQMEKEGKQPADGKQVMLGITKASLATNSFLSAASFQETTKVLTEAAIKGKVDPLIGLKENVIIGKLIPAGTGMKRYRDVRLNSTMPEPEVKVEDIAEELTEDEEIKDDEMITMDEELPEDEEFDVEESDEEEAAEDEADDQASDDAEDNE